MLITLFNLILIVPVYSHTVDNALLETPTIKCGPETIDVSVTTQNEFDGVLFTKDRRRVDGCFRIYDNITNTATRPSFSIAVSNLEKCGLEIRNNDNGTADVFGAVVISFHSNLVTKCDRIFAVHCVYKQSELTVATKLNLNEPDVVYSLNATAIPPVIGLKIVKGQTPDFGLNTVTEASVGDPLTLVWFLTQPSGIYGFVVQDCTTETRNGRKMPIISGGCTLDDVLISNVQYIDRSKAFANSVAFKFPDADDIWVTCSVRLCMIEQRLNKAKSSESVKNLNLCPLQPPNCNSRKQKRHPDERLMNPMDSVIVTQPIKIFGDRQNVSQLESLQSMRYVNPEEESVAHALLSHGLCMSTSTFSIGVALLAIFQLSTIFGSIMIICFIRKYAETLTTKTCDTRI